MSDKVTLSLGLVGLLVSVCSLLTFFLGVLIGTTGRLERRAPELLGDNDAESTRPSTPSAKRASRP